jgi:hypothetical protein
MYSLSHLNRRKKECKGKQGGQKKGLYINDCRAVGGSCDVRAQECKPCRRRKAERRIMRRERMRAEGGVR